MWYVIIPLGFIIAYLLISSVFDSTPPRDPDPDDPYDDTCCTRGQGPYYG